MENEVVLYDVTKYSKKEGYITVKHVIKHPLFDVEIKDEIVRLLLEASDPRRAVKFMRESCNCTEESACKVCLEILSDLYENVQEINFFEEENEGEKSSRPSVADPGTGLLQISQERKKEKQKGRRHIGVANKIYYFDKIHLFYADPDKLDKAENFRILT